MASSRPRQNNITISTSSSIRSPPPSGGPSPVSPSSPSGTTAGLSRRQSWSMREDGDFLTDQLPLETNHLTNSGFSAEEGSASKRNVGIGGPTSSTPVGRNHRPKLSERDITWAGIDDDGMGGKDNRGLWNDGHDKTPTGRISRSYKSTLASSASPHSSSSSLDVPLRSFSEDRERLTPGQSFDIGYTGLGRSTASKRSSHKPYDTSTSTIGRRSPLRNVSQTIRKASIRVVNMMGTDTRERLGSDDDGEEVLQDEYIGSDGLRRETDGGREGWIPSPKRPNTGLVKGTPNQLRGRTLCMFGSHSILRRSMDTFMRFPWTEPTILVLIIANAVILSIQSAPTLFSPREDDGFFQSWEDVALMALFMVFTLEMFARIIVTGLLLDPETSLWESLFGPEGIVIILKNYFSRTTSNLQRRPSKIRRAAWRSHAIPHPHLKFRQSMAHNKPNGVLRGLSIPEAPFQEAVAKQKSLSDQGRPYLRHSWHRIDMIAVFAFWITFVLALTGYEATANRHIYIFRALSALRAGRLLVITSGTTTILHSLKRAGPLLVTVAYFLIFAGCIYSIIGVQSFRGSFKRACVLTDPFNSSNTITLDQLCGGWLDNKTMKPRSYLDIDGFETDVSPKGYVCPIGQVCLTTNENPNNGVSSFDNIFTSLVQIVIITSINTWAPVMYRAMDSEFFGSSLFFITGVIVLNFWLINLLIAVVINTFSDIRAETKRSAFGGDESFLGNEPNWAAEDERVKRNRLLGVYQKTELFWVFLIVADIVVQGTKNNKSSENLLRFLKNLGLGFTLAFDLEIIIRFLAHLPNWRSFLTRRRNTFDLFLCIVCSIIQIPVISDSSIYPWLTVFQIVRWYRVILAFPRMKPLMITVFGSFAGMLNMVMFLFLINFLGALMAVQLFRGDLTKGNTVTFAQTYNSFLGMYQIFSSENWTDILYNVMGAERSYKQTAIAAIFICGWFLFANFIVMQMFIAVINENFAIAEELKRKQQVEAFIRKAETPSAHVSWIDRLNPYRLISSRHKAIRISALPPSLVLPLKQSVGFDLATENANLSLQNPKSAKGAIRRLLGRRNDEKAIPLKILKGQARAINGGEDEDEDDRGLTDLLPPLHATVSTDEHLDALRERKNQQADFIAAHPSFDRSLWIFKQSNPIRKFCQACFPPAYGERIFGRSHDPIMKNIAKGIVFLAVVASVVVAAIASPSYRRNLYAEKGVFRGTWFDLTEVALGSVLILEAVMKIIADGFIFAPNAYLLSLWNVLDLVILITLLINTITSLIFIGGLSRVTRALKSFRVLRMITLFSVLRDTLHAVLFAGALKILDASIFMILYLIPFAIWGLNIFSGLLYYCNDDNVSNLAGCIGEFSASSIDSSLSYLVPRVWANPTLNQSVWSFDSFRESILILFEIVSLEGWIDVMSSVMNIVGRDQQPQDQASQWNAIFLLIFNLFGGVIILTLFVSIIIKNFSTRSGNALLTTEQRQWVDLSKFIKAQTPSQLPKGRPRRPLQAWCYDRAVNKNGFWTIGFTMIYYLHILLLMMEDFSENLLDEIQLDWIFLCLTMLYAVDLLVRFYGLGFKSFRANGWNLFDLVVITGSFATTIPALQADIKGITPNQANVQLQKLFLVSITLKLVQRISSLNQLFKTSVASLPAIGNLFLLWATLFVFYAILFLEVFGLTKMGNNSSTRFQNYYSFGNALVMLAFMSTGEGWNGYMHDYTIQFPRCSESGNFLNSDCGSAPGAYLLFISWNIVSMYIFLNMFTGVVVESFAYVYQLPGKSSLNREDMRAFKKLWAEFDTERAGYLRRKDFVKFFSRLTGVFEMRPYPIESSIPYIVRNSTINPAQSSSETNVVEGTLYTIDLGLVATQISQIDYKRVRERRELFSRLFYEARLTEEKGKGISFTSMLMMLAHYKLIDDEKALELDDLLVRRVKTERVIDMVNLDRVRSLFRAIHLRKQFLAERDARKRTLNAEAKGIPAIVLEPTPATPPGDRKGIFDPFDPTSYGTLYNSNTSVIPPGNPFSPSSPRNSDVSALSLPVETSSLPASVPIKHATESPNKHSPSPSFSGSHNYSIPRHTALGRQLSNSSHLSSEDAHYRRESSLTDSSNYDQVNDISITVWGDMMRDAVEEEEK
ncbi:hypothetical protein L204_100220 [Cryptococcus depauperatus]